MVYSGLTNIGKFHIYVNYLRSILFSKNIETCFMGSATSLFGEVKIHYSKAFAENQLPEKASRSVKILVNVKSYFRFAIQMLTVTLNLHASAFFQKQQS